MNDLPSTPIEYLKGVGPQKAALLGKEMEIHNYGDLLFHFPYRYVDRSYFTKIKDLHYEDSHVQLKGKVDQIKETGKGRYKKLSARFYDDTGSVQLIWFRGVSWIKSSLNINETYIIFGKPKIYSTKWSIPHPEMTIISHNVPRTGFFPLYPSTEKLNSKGLNSKGIEKLISLIIPQIGQSFPESLSEGIVNEYRLISKKDAIKKIHQPNNQQDIQQAVFRLKFEELFYLQLELLIRKKLTAIKHRGFVFKEVGTLFNTFYKDKLPFQLTNAQKKVIKEIRKDFLSGEHMNRLLQGDVGSGKTLVALMTMLLATDNGYQAAIMAPTEILATQHFESLTEFLSDLPIRVSLLTGSTKKSQRKFLHEGLENGEIHILVGTHALLEDTVKFKNIGLVVIDEQHRFGVAQRSKMWAKNTSPPHILIMTATPIPRTLAMTFYGDLEVSVIDELPPGRKEIKTSHRYEKHRLKVFEFVKAQIKLGRQIYMVYPLIKESEKLDFHNLMDGFESVSRSFPLPEYKVSIVHGQMKSEEKDFEMQRFIKGETQIMVATTVIEVGVNVPNASVMVIESAERFGLSQLHQLRGRVGRGADQSFCILMTAIELSKESKKRMQTMVDSNDGFEIAEVDLKLRGPGDLMGTQQSGILDLKISDLRKDGQIVLLAREAARKLIQTDPKIELDTNDRIKKTIEKILLSKPDWGKIA
ncbi:ATP-dependent DNA helicase RecG [Crocinitomicaceae bacterium]|nr:ATP-dependent DNA helicase RecG [Crocinitomicaceae bacterium]MDC1244495.1 ATP-dependent DNA helicase RecG [Crocinitomicaceae bacterium]